MKTNRLFVCLNSVVVILAAMFYLSGVAMAQSPKEQKPADKTPPPQLDTFGDDGTPTFEDMPTPTFQPPIPTKQNGKDKEQKEKKEKKDKGDGVVTIQAALPDLKYVSTVVTPVGDVAGGSGVTGQAATLTITILNNGSGTAGEFRLDTWKHLPFPPNFGSIGDFSETFPSLAGNTSMSVSYSFTMANSYGTYFPRSTVDSGSLVVETSEVNNTNFGSYTVIEMATVVPPTINTVSGASVVFRGVAKNYGKKWPVEQPSALITVPSVGSVTVPHNGTATLAGVGTFGPIVKNLIGDASLTCALAENFGGRATITFICGTSTASGELRSVCLGTVSPSGTIIATGTSLTLSVPTNPANSTWPAGAPTATISPAGAGTLSPVGTTTGNATVTFFSDGTFTGVATVTFNYGSCTSSSTVTVAQVDLIRFQNSKMAPAWKDVDKPYKNLGVFTGQSVTFGVVTTPSGVTLPNGFLTWGGLGSGTTPTITVTFTTAQPLGAVNVVSGGKTTTALVSIWDQPSGLGEIAYAALHPVYTAIALANNLIGPTVTTLEPFVWASAAYPGIQHNTIADAARHSYWTCLLTRYTVAGYALGLTTAHEVSSPGPATETVMDLSNNLSGISIEGAHTHTAGLNCCRSAVQSAISAGTLLYLDSSYGATNTAEDALLQPTNK